MACILNRLVGLGHAPPGSVIAVGVLIPVTHSDNWLASMIESAFGVRSGLLHHGRDRGAGLRLSCALPRDRASHRRGEPDPDHAQHGRRGPLPRGAARAPLRRVHLPLLRGGLLTAALLVFVDVMKELPATLEMRPFKFDTLATQAYVLASDERLSEASSSALAIIAVGVLPLVAISRQIARGRRE